MNESTLLTEMQENIMKSYGYTLTVKGENIEVWKVSGEEFMIDVGKENNIVWCNLWLSEQDIKTFSPKRIKSNLKKYLIK